MNGPRPPGFWQEARRAANGLGAFKHFQAGRSYVVVAAFTDHDGDAHRPGERWIFLGSSFQPHDDGLSLFVSLDGDREWQIRLQWRAEEQGAIIDRLEDYLAAAPN